MDVLADLLARARAQGALFANWTAYAPWGMTFDDDAPVSFHAVLEGEVWVRVHGAEPQRALQGDVLLIAGRQSYDFTHAPGAVVSTRLADMPRHAIGDRVYRLDGPGAATQLVCGAYSFTGSICDGLLASLPPLVVLRSGDGEPAMRTALALLVEEIRRDAPGQQVVLDRLLDLLLIYTVREWFQQPGATPPAWYAALSDATIGPALHAIHAAPDRAWTVAELAGLVGLSRAAFARRFTAAIGAAPLAYVTNWRMSLAADALLRPGVTLAEVAREVGYANEFAFGAAFKRHRGVAPGRWRTSARDAAAA